jgi:hypothetical protein
MRIVPVSVFASALSNRIRALSKGRIGFGEGCRENGLICVGGLHLSWQGAAQLVCEYQLFLLALLKLAIVAMVVVDMSLYGAAIFGVLFAISLGMVVWYLRGLKE